MKTCGIVIKMYWNAAWPSYFQRGFCCISTGEFHFPNDEAARIAVDTVIRFLKEHQNAMDRVVFNVFKDEDRIIYENLIGKERG